ncbi:hypothetical protein [Limnospira platensis]
MRKYPVWEGRAGLSILLWGGEELGEPAPTGQKAGLSIFLWGG